jgi:hypothetical protein
MEAMAPPGARRARVRPYLAVVCGPPTHAPAHPSCPSACCSLHSLVGSSAPCLTRPQPTGPVTNPVQQAFTREHAAAGRITAALEHAASWSDAVGEAHLGACAPTGGAAAAAAALFAVLHKTGARGWGLGCSRSSGGASADGSGAEAGANAGAGAPKGGKQARRRRSSASSSGAGAGGSSSGGGLSRRASRRASGSGSRGGGPFGRPSSADGDALYELMGGSGISGLEGPLSRSINLQKQRSAAAADAAQIVGRSLHQVPEGEREGAGACAGARAWVGQAAATCMFVWLRLRVGVKAGDCCCRAVPGVLPRLRRLTCHPCAGMRARLRHTDSPLPSPNPGGAVSKRGRELLMQLRRPSQLQPTNQQVPQPRPPPALEQPASGKPRACGGHTPPASAPAPEACPSPELLRRSPPAGAAPQGAPPPQRSARTSACGGAPADVLTHSLAGRPGPLTQSIAARRSATLSQMLVGDEDSFQRLLANVLAGEAARGPVKGLGVAAEAGGAAAAAAAVAVAAAAAGPVSPPRSRRASTPGDAELCGGGAQLPPAADSAAAAAAEALASAAAPAATGAPAAGAVAAAAALLARRMTMGGAAPATEAAVQAPAQLDAAPSGGQMAYWGSAPLSLLGQPSIVRRSLAAPLRGMPAVPEGPEAAAAGSPDASPPGAATAASPALAPLQTPTEREGAGADAGLGEEYDEAALLEFDLLETAAAQVIASHRAVDAIETRLHLPRSAPASPDHEVAAIVMGVAAARRRLWAAPPSPPPEAEAAQAQGTVPAAAAVRLAAATTAAEAIAAAAAPQPQLEATASDPTVAAPSPTRAHMMAALAVPVPVRRHTVGHDASHSLRAARGQQRAAAAEQRPPRAPAMDVLGRRTTAPAAPAAPAPPASPPRTSAENSAAAMAVGQAGATATSARAEAAPRGAGARQPLPRRSLNLGEVWRTPQGGLNPLITGLAQRPRRTVR